MLCGKVSSNPKDSVSAILEAEATISVIIAAINEEEGIGLTLAEFRKFAKGAQLVVVDGRSTDRTVEIAKQMGAIVLLQKGKGKGNAMYQGIIHLDSRVRYIIFTDGDYTYPARYVPKMIEILENDSKVGMVVGDRFNKGYNGGRISKNGFYLGNRILGLLYHMVNENRLNDPLSGLRVVRAKALRNWKPKSEGFAIEVELNSYIERKRYRIVEVPITYRSRLGEKKLKFRHGLDIMRRIIADSLLSDY